MTAGGDRDHPGEGVGPDGGYDPFGLDLDLDVVTTADLLTLHGAVLAQPRGATGVVVAQASHSELVDPEGTRYVDCLSGPGDARFGHRHPRLVAAARRQLDRSGLLGPDVIDEQTGRFARDLAALVGHRRVVVLESGAAARSLAVAVARAWVAASRGIAPASVVVASVVGDRMPPSTPAVLVVEAVDPEAVRVSDGRALRELAARVRERGGVVVADERLTGLGRCGFTSLVEELGVRADLAIHGEALGGGLVRVGAISGRADILGLAADIAPTGLLRDPLASAVGLETVAMLGTGEYQRRATTLAALLRSLLHPLVGEGLTAVRVAGLWAGLDIDPMWAEATDIAARLKCYGVLVSPRVGSCLVVAPPLVTSEDGIRQGVEALQTALRDGRSSVLCHGRTAGRPPVERLTSD
jgi:ornithine--oxo-acid transaminase